jgi:hypothetical protein
MLERYLIGVYIENGSLFEFVGWPKNFPGDLTWLNIQA